MALKVILAGGYAGAAQVARFRREAEALARLQHPNIIQVHELGEYDGRPYIALEFVDGGSLARAQNGDPLPPPPAAAIVEALARAVQAAHDWGIIHRDLKPANVLLPAGTLLPKIADFGLAKRLDEESETESGAALGTPSYMAPEQAAGKVRELGPAVDIYALGAVLYELLTGRPPFRGASAVDTIQMVFTQEPVPPGQLQPKTPRDLETICLKCLQKAPRKRYATALAVAEDLRRFLAGEPIVARPVGLAERAVKWARRRPAVASLAALALFLTVLGFVQVSWQLVRVEEARQDAVDAAGKEREAREAAETARDATRVALTAEQAARGEAERLGKAEAAARDEAEFTAYVQKIYRAEREHLAGNTALASQLLDDCAPAPGRPDLRGWEWQHLLTGR